MNLMKKFYLGKETPLLKLKEFPLSSRCHLTMRSLQSSNFILGAQNSLLRKSLGMPEVLGKV